MGQELVQVIDQISKEKGISREMVIEAVETALVSAAKKKYGTQRIAVQIDDTRLWSSEWRHSAFISQRNDDTIAYRESRLPSIRRIDLPVQ